MRKMFGTARPVVVVLALALATASHAFQEPPVDGTWRWVGTEKKVELKQTGGTVTGKITDLSGATREVEGTLSRGKLELAEYIPPSAAGDMAGSVWREVVKRRGDAGHPNMVRGTLSLTYDTKNYELSGSRTTYSVTWKKSTGQFEGLRDESDSIRLVRVFGTCGPDVSRKTLAILRQMATEFLADEKSQSGKCKALVSMETAEYAWDIHPLFGDAGEYPKSATATRPESAGAPSVWETATGAACATPRWPCVKSVEFFGACHDSNVVNYTMWGMTKTLCKDQLTINTQQWVAAGIRNLRSPDVDDQKAMSEVGQKYGEFIVRYLKDKKRYDELARQYRAALKSGAAAVERFFKELPADLRTSDEDAEITRRILQGVGGIPSKSDFTNDLLFPELQRLVAARESGYRAAKWCDTTCDRKLTPDQKKKVEEVKFDYTWRTLK